MRVPPDNLEGLEETYSNFDCEMPDGVEAALRTGKVSMDHPAWDHWGVVWFADGRFHEMVKQYQAHVETVSADRLDDLVREVNDRYGWG